MAKSRKIKESGTKEVVLSGSLSLRSAAEIRNQLLIALDEADTVNILLQDVEDVDLSLIQILCSAHRSAHARGKSFVMPESLPDMFVQIVEDAGFQGHIGCSDSGAEGCVWKNLGTSM